jgi:hypothetical protein
MAVLHFDHGEAQEVHFEQGGNQHRKTLVGCGAFLGVFLIGGRLLSKSRASRLVAGKLLYIWPGA